VSAARPGRATVPTETALLEGVAEVSAAVESGAGLPDAARAASRALAASIVVIDSSSSVLAVACRSPEDERAVIEGVEGGGSVELRFADTQVGELRYLPHGEPPPDMLLRMVATLLAIEADRAVAPERESDAAVAALLSDVLNRRLTDRQNIVARAHELGTDLEDGATAIVVRVRPQRPAEGDWRGRALTLAERGARAVERTAMVAPVPLPVGRGGGSDSEDELVVVIPGGDRRLAARAAESIRRELEASLNGYALAIATSRPASDPVDLYRAGAEALLAANVAEAQGDEALAFEETGAYRLLLPAMSEDPRELQRFYDETVAPLVAYDEEYETELLRTLESFLEADGSIANTAERLFTHRHTIRYRLERVRDLSGHDVGSSDGRERLSLGLKAMRVLGIAPPHGPATEPGAQAGRVRREKQKER
jgi:PucR family transcriptional regulator, purine catabolism regulatory protein